MTPRLAIVNPAAAGGRTERRWPPIVDALRERGVELEVELTTRPGEASGIARGWIARGGREFVVLGGDGTLNEVAAGCVREDGSGPLADDIVLSIVHQGTGGDLGRGLGIPRRAADAVEVAARGRVRRIDLGMASFRQAEHLQPLRAWLSCCNVGLGADVVARTGGRLKRLGDTAGFAVATVATLARNRRRDASVVLDDTEPLEIALTEITAANNRYMGGGMLVAPDAEIDDGLMDVVLIGAASRSQLLRAFPRIYRGTHVGHRLVSVRRARTLAVHSRSRPLGVVLDGELVGSTPARFWLLRQAIGVRVPA